MNGNIDKNSTTVITICMKMCILNMFQGGYDIDLAEKLELITPFVPLKHWRRGKIMFTTFSSSSSSSSFSYIIIIFNNNIGKNAWEAHPGENHGSSIGRRQSTTEAIRFQRGAVYDRLDFRGIWWGQKSRRLQSLLASGGVFVMFGAGMPSISQVGATCWKHWRSRSA